MSWLADFTDWINTGAAYFGLCEMRYSLRSPLFMYSSTIITYNVTVDMLK